jgi:hypothetical protein
MYAYILPSEYVKLTIISQMEANSLVSDNRVSNSQCHWLLQLRLALDTLYFVCIFNLFVSSGPFNK